MYAANIRLDVLTLMLLRRLRRALDAATEGGCPLTDSELIMRGLACQLEALGVSADANAAMLTGLEPEPA